MDTKRDFWSKFEVMSRIAGAILIPLTIFWVGQKFNEEKEQANRDQRDFQNTVELLKLCNNENEDLRLAGFNYAVYLQGKNLLDDGLIAVLSSVQAEEKDAETAIKTGKILEEIKAKSKRSASLEVLDIELFSRVYLHINQEAQRASAKRVKTILESQGADLEHGMSIPGIELKAYDIATSQLRVFKSDEVALANTIVKLLRDTNIQMELVDLSKRYPNANMRPRHFEIWFGTDFE